MTAAHFNTCKAFRSMSVLVVTNPPKRSIFDRNCFPGPLELNRVWIRCLFFSFLGQSHHFLEFSSHYSRRLETQIPAQINQILCSEIFSGVFFANFGWQLLVFLGGGYKLRVTLKGLQEAKMCLNTSSCLTHTPKLPCSEYQLSHHGIVKAVSPKFG